MLAVLHRGELRRWLLRAGGDNLSSFVVFVSNVGVTHFGQIGDESAPYRRPELTIGRFRIQGQGPRAIN